MRFARGFFFVTVMAVALPGCVGYAPQYLSGDFAKSLGPELPQRSEVSSIPFVPNDDLYCGPAALSMVLRHLGREAPFDEIAPKLFLPGRQGTLQLDMLSLARTYGVTPYIIDPTITALVEEVSRGRPVVVLENFGFKWRPVWHYSTVTGYDLTEKTVVRKSGIRERSVTPIIVFEHLWKAEGYWGFVLLAPGDVPARPNRDRWFLALSDSERHMSPTDAEKSWRAFISEFPTHGLGHAALGNVDFNGGKFQDAAKKYKDALALEPNNSRIATLAETVFIRALERKAAECARRVKSGQDTWPCPS